MNMTLKRLKMTIASKLVKRLLIFGLYNMALYTLFYLLAHSLTYSLTYLLAYLKTNFKKFDFLDRYSMILMIMTASPIHR